jgi:hypothetical protein
MLEASIAVLFCLIAFIGGTRFGVWLAEHEMKSRESPAPANRAHMFPVEHRRVEAMMKYAHRRGLRKNR